MKTISRLFRAFTIALTSALGVTAAIANEPPVRIMPIGDSLTSGVSDVAVPGAYRNRLHLLLSSAGYNVDFVGTFADVGNAGLPDVDHQGLGSARIDQIQSSLDGWLNSVQDPDVVLLMIGTNDFWQNYQLATVQSRLSALIADIATKRPFAKIIVSNLPYRSDNVAIETEQFLFSAAIPGIVAQQVALGRQVSYVDMHSAWSPSDLSSDGVHPTAIGFGKMADVWFPAIAGVIAPKGTVNSPVIARAGPVTNLSQVPIVFSKPVADSSANLANFSISGGLTITSAVLDATTKRTVTLTTSPQTPGVVYTLTVNGVRDRTASQTPIAPGSMVNFSTSALTNGSFESDLAGWTTTGNLAIKSGTPYVMTDGTKLVAFNPDQTTPNGVLSQTFATTIGQTYQLSFDAGALGFNTNDQRIQVTVQGSTSLVNDITTIKALNGGTTRWVAKSYNFVANSATTTLTFTDLSGTVTTNIDLVLDNVRVGSPVTRTLAVTSTPIGGAGMTISPSDIGGNGNGNTGLIRSYLNGASVTVTAPVEVTGRTFLRWQNNGVDVPGSLPAITVLMNTNHTLNAVYGSNNSPVAVADAYSTPSNTPLVVPAVGVLTNDSDPDGSTVLAVLDSPPGNGALTLNPNGSFTYTPTSGYVGLDSFSYHANDGVTDSNVVTVSLTVYSNTSQLLTNGSFEAGTTGWTTSGNFIVQGSAPYTFTNGTKLVAFNANQLTPNGIFSQTFPTVSGTTYQLAFDMGAFGYNNNTQRLEVKVQGSTSILTQTLSVTGISGGNTRWIAQNLSFTANSASTTLSFRDVSTVTNSVDLTLDNVRVIGASASRTLTVESSPISGVVVGISPADRNAESGGNTTFTRSYAEGSIVNLSAPPSSGASAFLKWQKNGADLSTNRNINVVIDANVTLAAIYASNTAPVANPDNQLVVENTALTVNAPGILGNDTDADANTLIAVLVSPPSNGNLTLNPNGSFIYTPNSNYTGPDSFTYRANDGSLNSAVTTVSLTVTALATGTVNNGSFESGVAGWTVAGNQLVIDATTAYPARDGSKLMVFNGNQSLPTAVISQSFNTVAGQAYVLELEMGVVGVSGSVQRMQVTIAGSSNLVSRLETVTRNGGANATWVTKSFAFIANSTSTTLTLADVSQTHSGMDLLIDHVRLATGSARTLNVVSSSSTGVNVTVSPADILAQGNGTTSFTRLYSNNAEVTLTAPSSHLGGAFTKWQKNGADYSVIFSTSVTMDGNHTMTAVYAVNSAPVAVANAYSVDMDSVLTVSGSGVLGNDTDAENQNLTAAVAVAPVNGDVVLNTDGSFIYTPDLGFSGTDSFTYLANDGFLSSTPATVEITVVPLALGTLVNGSFESDLTGWTSTGYGYDTVFTPASHVAVSSAAPYIPTNGSKLVVFNPGNPGTTVVPNGSISQTFATTVGKTYVINLDAGAFATQNSLPVRLRVTIQGTATHVNIQESITDPATSHPTATWTARTYTFVADSATTTLTLADNSVSGQNRDLLVDNVRCAIQIRRTLTVGSSPDSGLAITVSPADVNAASNGTTSLTRSYENGAVVTLTAPATAGTADFFKWTRNGIDFATTATTTVTMNSDVTMVAVYGNNNPPVASGETYNVNQGAILTVPNPGVLTNDTDLDANTLSTVLGVGPTSGSLDLNINGGFTYAPNLGFTGVDSFTYRASDGIATSALATVTINVQAVATGALVNGSFEDGETGWTITGNRAVVSSAAPYLSTDERKLMVFNAGQVSAGAVMSQVFATTPGQTYKLELDMGVVGASTLSQRLQVNIAGSSVLVNQLETITGVGASIVQWVPKSYTFTANSASTTLTFGDASTTGTNIDLLLDNVRVNLASTRTLIVTAPGAGVNIAVSPNDRAGRGDGSTRLHRFYGDGTVVSLTAPATYGGGNFLRWTKNGESHATTAATTVTMDGDHTLAAVYTSPPQLLVNGNFSNDLTGWTPTGNLEIKNEELYGSATRGKVVAFNTTNLTPNGSLSQSFPTIIGQTYDLTFDMGVLAFNTNTQRLSVVVAGASNVLSQTISVRGVNGTLLWVPQNFSFVANSETSTLTFRDVSTTTSVIDLTLDNVAISGASTQRTITIGSTPASGVDIAVSPADLGGNSNGVTNFERYYEQGTSVTLTAPPMSGADPFLKWKRDDADLATTASVTLQVDGNHTYTAVYAGNSAPVAAGDNYTTPLNTTLTVEAPGVLANDTDVDLNGLTAEVVSGPASGTLNLFADGGFTYAPSTGFEGPVSFTYRTSDGVLNSNTVTVNISVTNIVPGVLVNGSFENDETGWTNSGSRVVATAATPYSARQGTKLMVFNGGGTPNNGVVSQSFATVVGQTYAIDFDMGVVGTSSVQQRLQISATGTSSLLSQIETMNGGGANTTRWLPKSFSFVANSTTTTVAFTDVSNATANVDMTLDNVRIVTGTTRELIFNTTSSTPISVTVSPADLNAAGNGITQFTRSYAVGTVLTISAAPGGFVHWERNGSPFSTNATTNLTVNGNEYITAVTTGTGVPVTPQTLTVSSSPASGVLIAVTPADTLAQADGTTQFTRTYNTGAVVTLTAPASSGGMNFSKWQRNGVDFATTAAATVTMDASYTMTALYVAVGGGFVNGSFENGLTGWTTAGTANAVRVQTAASATNGTAIVDFNSNSTPNDGVLSQTFSTTPGVTYTVRFRPGCVFIQHPKPKHPSVRCRNRQPALQDLHPEGHQQWKHQLGREDRYLRREQRDHHADVPGHFHHWQRARPSSRQCARDLTRRSTATSNEHPHRRLHPGDRSGHHREPCGQFQPWQRHHPVHPHLQQWHGRGPHRSCQLWRRCLHQVDAQRCRFHHQYRSDRDDGCCLHPHCGLRGSSTPSRGNLC
jgi:lysophospholipase L1-like esterase